MLFMRLAPDGVLHFARDYHLWANPPYQFLFVAPAWSLGVELSFYLIAPFLVRRRWWIICICIGVSLVIRIAMWRLLTHSDDPRTKYLNGDPWSYRFFPSEVGTFLMGALGYHFYAYARQKKMNIRPLGWVAWIVILLAIFFLQPMKAHHVPPELFTLMMPVCVPFIFALSKGWKADRWIGELSYPVYIAHVVVGSVIARKVGAHVPGDVKGWMLMLWTLPIAILIRVCVEQPIDRWRQHLHNTRHREPASVISPAPM
jgi:peptidoglycan/LPS O-acetylase OafA/YrhL